MIAPARRGVALIIAISVLAALLLLALPFIFSQSASVAGARAASWDGVARRGSDRAAGLATALGAYATGLHRSPQLVDQLGMAQLGYVQLPLQIQDSTMVGYPSFDDGAHRSVLESVAGWPSLGGVLPKLDTLLATHGAQIEDEARRIDPNCLGEYAWSLVLARAGIRDPHTIYWNWGTQSGGNPPTAPINLSSVGYWRQANYGRLARALAVWRPANSVRYNRLEDLLGADPYAIVNSTTGRRLGSIPFGPAGHDRNSGAAIWPPPASSEAIVESTRDDAESDPAIKAPYGDSVWDPVNGGNVGFRVYPLTTAELERLKPLLTFQVPGQGRSGMIDLGTVVAAGDWANGSRFYGVTHDDLRPDAHNLGQPLRTGSSWAMTIQARTGRDDSSTWQSQDDALAMFATPALNVNTVPGSGAGSELSLLFSQNPSGEGWPADPVLNPIISIGRLPRLAWLDPRNGDGANRFERPPLALHGFGVFAIEGAANALDPQGKSVGQRRRRTLVQAVPQERVLEAAWTTQGEIEALLLARHGSWMMSGPHPVARIKDYGVGDTDAMLALDSAGWLAPAPVSSFGQNPAVNFDWHVPFGLTHPTPWASITHAYSGTRPTRSGSDPSIAPSVQTALASDLRPAAGGAPGRLTPHGLHLKANERIAWDMGDNGPWRAFASATNDPRSGQLMGRHLSMRFRIPAAVPMGEQAVLMEARAQRPGADTHRALRADSAEAEDGFGVPDVGTDDQFVWRVHYDPDGIGGPQLVLAMANAALPWRSTDRERFGITGTWLTGSDQGDAAGIADLRTLPGTLPFAPPWQAQRVEFRYLVPGGLNPDRWYHLQVYAGSDRPGEHGLILDGIVGRDAITANAAGEPTRLGDHYTFPSLRLGTTALETPLPPGTTGNAHLAVAQVPVQLPPGFTGVEQILPARGLIRINDEFFSYDEASGTTLLRVARARRQNTNQAATETDTNGNGVPDPGEDVNGNGVLDTTGHWRRWPIVQGHRQGALVTPGWSQFRLGARPASGDPFWYHGAVQLVGPAEDPNQGLTATPPTAPVTSFNDPANSGQPVSVDIGTPIPCPVYTHAIAQPYVLGDRGFLEFWQMQSGQYQPVARCSFIRAGNSLTLSWTDSLAGGWVYAVGGQTLAVQISIEVDGTIADDTAFQRFANTGLLQLLDRDSGRIEWVRYDARRELGLNGADGRFFINTGGWSLGSTTLHRPGFGRSDTDPPGPLTHTRGAMRTGWRQDSDGPWPGKPVGGGAGTIVLPVQMRFGIGDRFESGDVVTVVPDIADDATRQAPMQMVVRHACRDGLPSQSDSGAHHDTINEYFALTHQVPVPLRTLAGASTVLIGRGWSGDDLSPLTNPAPRRGMMPTLVGLDGPDPTPALHLGSGQGLPTRPAADYPPDASVEVIIDDLAAGVLRGTNDRNDNEPIGVRAFILGSAQSNTLAANADLPATALLLGDVIGNAPTYGLMRIDGEVFAFRRVAGASDRVDLIGRGLLGSARRDHALAADVQLFTDTGLADANRIVRQTLPAVVLPMGPVGELASAIAPTDQGTALDVVEIPFANYYRDPPASGFSNAMKGTYWGVGVPHNQMLGSVGFQLVHEPAATAVPKVEILRLLDYPTQANQDTVAPWLRGLYGTSPQTWTPGFANPSPNRPAEWKDQDNNLHVVQLALQDPGQLNPIIIGWWPRFAPPLATDLADATDQSAHLRSRSFAWAGFPLRFHGSRFDPANVPALRQNPDAAINPLTKGIADVPGDGGGLSLEVRALAAGDGLSQVFDWASAVPSSNGLGLIGPFAWSRFEMREVDGAELRVHWRARSAGASPLETIADNQGRAPRLGAADAELGQPPAARAGIRLRCVAPVRVLAVEEVR